jgi:hypothetical protein
MRKEIFDEEFLTQQEVAGYFKVVPATVKNWRDRGLLSYWRAPGSTRVLYFSDEIKAFRDKNTVPKKGGDRPKAESKKVKPCISSTDKEWRI